MEAQSVYLEIPETLDIWSELSPRVKKDLVALSILTGESVKRMAIESLLLHLESSISNLGYKANYEEEKRQLENLQE